MVAAKQKCKRCKADIVWLRTAKGAWMPVDLSDPVQVARCFNYLNYQPLRSGENMSKRHHLKQATQSVLGL